MADSPPQRFFDWLYDARNIFRWVSVGLSVISVAFAALSYFGFWNHFRKDDLLDALASRLDSSYAADISRQVRPGEPEWTPLIQVIERYSKARGDLPKDRLPVVFARAKAVTSAQSNAGEWKAA
jgi:hypothetical protein